MRVKEREGEGNRRRTRRERDGEDAKRRKDVKRKRGCKNTPRHSISSVTYPKTRSKLGPHPLAMQTPDSDALQSLADILPSIRTITSLADVTFLSSNTYLTAPHSNCCVTGGAPHVSVDLNKTMYQPCMSRQAFHHFLLLFNVLEIAIESGKDDTYGNVDPHYVLVKGNPYQLLSSQQTAHWTSRTSNIQVDDAPLLDCLHKSSTKNSKNKEKTFTFPIS